MSHCKSKSPGSGNVEGSCTRPRVFMQCFIQWSSYVPCVCVCVCVNQSLDDGTLSMSLSLFAETAWEAGGWLAVAVWAPANHRAPDCMANRISSKKLGQAKKWGKRKWLQIRNKRLLWESHNFWLMTFAKSANVFACVCSSPCSTFMKHYFLCLFLNSSSSILWAAFALRSSLSCIQM